MSATELSSLEAQAPVLVTGPSADRSASWRRAFECELPGTRQEFEETMARAEALDWPEVGRAALYGVLRHVAESSPGDGIPVAGSLLEVAQRDGDLDMVALALAWRAWLGTVRAEGSRALVDEDLARAVVLLERRDGDPVVKATAHFRVAFCMWERKLWELTDAQLEAAELMVDEVDPLRRDPLLHRAAIALDRVMVDLDWALTLRQVEDRPGVLERRDAQEAHVRAAAALDMPELWREHIAVARLVMEVLCDGGSRSEVAAHLARVSESEELAEWAPALHLALALCAAGTAPAEAAEAAERAVVAAEAAGDTTSPTYLLALYQAAVLEAEVAGRTTAGLRSAEALARQRELDRRAVLAGQVAAIGAQRLRGERDLFVRQAHSDPLTGLANRRGLQAHLSALAASGVGGVALVLFDMDSFKSVNDRYGHLTGDRVLQRVSEVMSANVRSEDFLARLGGDEFLLLLRHADHEVASRRAEAVAASVGGMEWHGALEGLRVSLSYGVAVGDISGVLELTHEADTALHRAKFARRATA